MRGLNQSDDPNLLVGFKDFADAGVYRIAPDLALVQTVDFFPPLVNDPFVFGQIAAANALSDCYAMGATPTTALNIVAFPDGDCDESWLTQILNGGAERVTAAGAVVVGGHSVRDNEIKYGLAVTGLAHPDRILTNAGAKPGDSLILTKPLGTGFIATAHRRGDCSSAALETAIASMIALNDAASRVALQIGAHAVTDVTGYGLANHAIEMATASDCAIAIELASLPILSGAEPYAVEANFTRGYVKNSAFTSAHVHLATSVDAKRAVFLFDPQTSGGLLLATAAESTAAALDALRAAGLCDARVIGSVEEPSQSRLRVS